jgi:hypothetical protein
VFSDTRNEENFFLLIHILTYLKLLILRRGFYSKIDDLIFAHSVVCVLFFLPGNMSLNTLLMFQFDMTINFFFHHEQFK